MSTITLTDNCQRCNAAEDLYGSSDLLGVFCGDCMAEFHDWADAHRGERFSNFLACDVTYYGDECEVVGPHQYHTINYPNGTSVQWEGESLPRADYACAICGEPEGSDYARLCCENNVEMV